MLNHTDLKRGVRFILDGYPYEVLDSSLVFKGRGSSVVQTKIKNLVNGNVITKTFHTGEEFKEAEITKYKSKFIYSHRGKYFFSKEDNPSSRFSLDEEQIGKICQFLKPNQIVDTLEFRGKIINISLPIKIKLKVKEAAPGLKGDRAQSGTKKITLETGSEINAPLFIREGDIIEINTETGEYVKRVE